MNIICQHDFCTGCQVCRLVCPKQCISMQEDEKGNIYPIIDQSLCINCKKCQRICPSLNPPTFSKQPINVYAGWAKDKVARKYSTSGAISYVISKHFLQNGDFFCGSVWTKEGAVHKISSDIREIRLFQGSKYSHSDVKDCYKEILQLLESGKKLLFTGTPCQVSALRKFLGRDFSNLYTVDLICHGVPSRRILRDRITSIEQINRKKIVEIRFRDKQPDQLHTCCKYIFEDGTFIFYKYNEDFFFRSFVDNYALRENCFNCQYSKMQRVSDLTIADFWSYRPKSMKFYNYELGVSIIIVNSEKGNKLIDFIKHDIVYEKRNYQECSNRNMHAPQEKPHNYESFWKDYDSNMSRSDIQRMYFTKPIPYSPTLKNRISKFSNAFFPMLFIEKLKKLLGLFKRLNKIKLSN